MRMVIRVRDLKSKPEGEGCGPNSSGPLLLFPALLQPIRFFSYTLSVGLHALCVCLAILIGGLVSPAEPPAVEYRVKALIIRLPKPDTLSSPRPERETERVEDRAETLRKLADQLVVMLREGKVQALTNPEPAVETPPHPAPVEAVLIQPQYPLEFG